MPFKYKGPDSKKAKKVKAKPKGTKKYMGGGYAKNSKKK